VFSFLAVITKKLKFVKNGEKMYSKKRERRAEGR